MLAAAGILLGLSSGLASGGSFRNLRDTHLRMEGLVLVLFVLQAVARGRLAGFGATRFALWAWAVACIVLSGVLVGEYRRPGIWLLQTGLLLNALVVILNNGMPIALPNDVSREVAIAAVQQSAGFYQLANPTNLGLVLGDVFRLNLGGSVFLASPGDLLMVAGVSAFVSSAMVPVSLVEPVPRRGVHEMRDRGADQGPDDST